MAKMGKDRQRAGENFNKIMRRSLQRRNIDGMVNLTKMVSLAKIYHGFNKHSSWMPNVAPWKVANLTKMANLAIIRPRCNKLLM